MAVTRKDIKEALERFKKADNEYWELMDKKEFNDGADDLKFLLRALIGAKCEVERDIKLEKIKRERSVANIPYRTDKEE